jgi:hypothetical protein
MDETEKIDLFWIFLCCFYFALGKFLPFINGFLSSFEAPFKDLLFEPLFYFFSLFINVNKVKFENLYIYFFLLFKS